LGVFQGAVHGVGGVTHECRQYVRVGVQVIEQNDPLVRTDRQERYQLVRRVGVADVLEYRHQRAHDEQLLALPDVVAWCWARSGDWRRRIGPVLANVRHVGR
jgi:hypothetical protein